MEHIDRPKFRELRYTEDIEIPEEYDCVQLKMDGIWGCLKIADGQWSITSRTGKLKAEGEIEDQHLRCTLLGEYMFGSHWGISHALDGKFFAFDCIEMDGIDLREKELGERLSWCNIQANVARSFLDWIEICPTYGLAGTDWRELWKDMVEGQRYEGLVFKNASALYGEKNAWARMKAVVEIDYICTGFRPADEGTRYEGQVGAVIGTLSDKDVYVTCSGFTDEERELYTVHGDKYIGKVFTAKGNSWYPSGSVRHPKFKEWRDDKTPEECTVEQIPIEVRIG